VGKQPRRYLRRRLALLGGSLADRLAIEDATFKIDIGTPDLRIGRCGRDRAGPGVEAISGTTTSLISFWQKWSQLAD
jgi:hypothetical protein